MIQYYNRRTKKIESEKVFGTTFVDLAYKNKIGFFLTDHVFSRKWFSRIIGAVEDSALSTRKIQSFIENYAIDMKEYETSKYASFNEFFTRKFNANARPFALGDKLFCAGAEARYLAFENISAHARVKVKGIDIDLTELLGNAPLAKEFDGGSLIIARLCPVDYHRFHFPIDCKITSAYTVHGEFHSVNPVALMKRPEVFLINERQIAVLENPIFGKVAMIEVGALGVGKIVQSAYDHSRGFPDKFDKGQEKGYFLFGGSTVIWLIQKGKIALSNDLVDYSKKGIETWVPLGDVLGECKSD